MTQVQGKTFLRRVLDVGNAYGIRPDTAVDRAVARIRRPLDRRYMAHHGSLRDHYRLGSAMREVQPDARGARILVLALRSWLTHAAYEATIAQALRLRGAEVALLTCGGGQPVCEMGWGRRAYPRPCDRCAHYTDQMVEAADIRAYRLREQFAWGRRADAAPVQPPPTDVVDPGAAAEISAAWFLRSSRPAELPGSGPVVQDWQSTAAAVEGAAARVMDDFQPDVIFLLNGLFAAEQVVRDLAAARGVRTVAYEMAVHGPGLFLSQETPAGLEVGRTWDAVRGRPLTPEQAAAVERLLADRAQSKGTADATFDQPSGDDEPLRARLGIPAGSPVVSLFTGLTWDSGSLGRDVAYGSMFEWIDHAIDSIRGSDATLVVRVHPAEVRWGTAEPVGPTLEERRSQLPPNVRIVPPASPLNSYELMRASDLVLAYTTTVGMEASAQGIPVAVAGAPHYRGRGFTIDLESRTDLERLVAGPPPRLSREQVELARRYLFLFFFRLQTPFPVVDRRGDSIAALPTDPKDLAPGADPYVDFVCDRILDGEDFVLPDELIRLGQATKQ